MGSAGTDWKNGAAPVLGLPTWVSIAGVREATTGAVELSLNNFLMMPRTQEASLQLQPVPTSRFGIEYSWLRTPCSLKAGFQSSLCASLACRHLWSERARNPRDSTSSIQEPALWSRFPLQRNLFHSAVSWFSHRDRRRLRTKQALVCTPGYDLFTRVVHQGTPTRVPARIHLVDAAQCASRRQARPALQGCSRIDLTTRRAGAGFHPHQPRAGAERRAGDESGTRRRAKDRACSLARPGVAGHVKPGRRSRARTSAPRRCLEARRIPRRRLRS